MTTGELTSQSVPEATSWSLMDGRYPTLAGLRTAHLDLLTRYESNRAKPSEEFLDEVEVFLERGQRTGCAIESQTDRRAAQVLLDYWNALLFRCGRNRPVAILDEYDATLEKRLTFDAVECPYPGPVPFSAGQANRFFGREALVSDAIRLLERARVLALLGPAASGKTSLVRAGVLPALSSGAIDNSREWEYLVLTLGANPLEQLVRTCLPDAGEQRVTQTMATLRTDPSALAMLLAERRSVLLFVDQLEELYDTTDTEMAVDRETVLHQLEHIASASNLNVRMIVAACVEDNMTADTYSAALVPAESRIELPRMGTRELSDAILQPAEQIGLKFDEGVVADLVRTLIGVPGVLPLLQFVMLELWDKRDHNRITTDAFNAILWDPQRRRPNVVIPVTRKADSVYSALSPDDRAIADAVLLQLVEPGLGWDFALLSPRASEVDVPGVSRADVERVLGKFEAARLVRRNKIDAETSPRVRLIHESLPRYWQPLIDLLDGRRHEQRQKLRLSETATLWQERGRDRALLWAGLLLQEARGYTNLTPEEREFLDESDRVEHQASRRRARNIALMFAALVVVAAGSFLTAILLFRLNAISTSSQLAVVAQSQVASNPDRATLLAERAYLLDQNAATRQGLLFVVDHNVQLAEHLSDGATAMVVSPTGDMAAIGHLGGTIDVWGGDHAVYALPTEANGPTIVALAFAPTGSALLSVGRGGQLAYWDPHTLEPISPPPPELPAELPDALRSTNPNINSLVISSRGDVAVAATVKEAAAVKVFLWDASQRQWRTDPLATISRNAAALAFSPDGGRLLVGAGDCTSAGSAPCSGILELAPVQPEAAPATTPGYLNISVGAVHTLALGSKILAFGDGPSVVIWDLERDQQIAQVSPNARSTDPVDGIALSPDESVLAVGACQLRSELGGECLQGQVLFYSTNDGKPIRRALTGGFGPVRQVAFMPRSGGQRLISVSSDSVLVWDLRGATVAPQEWPIVADTNAVEAAQSVALEPQTGVLALGFQNLINVWRISADGTFPQIQSLKTSSGLVRAVAIGAGGTLAASGADGAVLRWNTRDWSTLPALPRPDEIPANQLYSITSLAVADEDARLLVAGGALGDVTLWNLDSGAPSVLQEPQQQDAQMTNAVAISPDGNLVAAGGCDAAGESSQQFSRCQLGHILLWDLRKSQTPVSLTAHAGAVQRLAFNADGSLLASIGYDGSVIVWNPETAQPVQQYAGLVGAKALMFLPDDTLQVYDQDSRVELKLVGLQGMQTRACAIARRDALSDPEWEAAVPTANMFQPALEKLQGLRDPVCQT